jgi:MFS family permease
MMSWYPFDGMAELVFKPVMGGYIYRAPSLWIFGGRHYRVNEAQKSELVMRHRSMLRILFWTIVAGGATAGPIAGAFMLHHGWAALGVSVLVGLMMGFVINWWLVRQVRPILAPLTPTSERITRGELIHRQAAVLSPAFLIGFGALSLAMFALSALRGVYGAQGWDFSAVIGTLLFGACTIYWSVLYVMKRRCVSADA